MDTSRGSSTEALRGACLCGTVSFALAPPYRWFTHCHCSMCRKHHGALFGTGLGVTQERFRWLAGQDDIVHYRATAAFERPFCRHCGTTVPAHSHLSDVWHVPAGLVDGDLGATPRTHIFVASKSSAVTITDTLPQYAAYPPGIDLPLAPERALAGPAEGIRGSCLCGAVAFSLDDVPQRILNCHCSLCRRSRGAAFASSVLAKAERFHWTRGRDLLVEYRLPAPRRYRVDFCLQCGSIVPSVMTGVGVARVPAGALDTMLPPLPMAHLHVASKAPWHTITDSWPQHTALPPNEPLAELCDWPA